MSFNDGLLDFRKKETSALKSCQISCNHAHPGRTFWSPLKVKTHSIQVDAVVKIYYIDFYLIKYWYFVFQMGFAGIAVGAAMVRKISSEQSWCKNNILVYKYYLPV